MFFDQSFALIDIPRLLTLSFLEILLSADNALMIAVFIKSLPQKQRNKAVLIGIISAFFLRGFALIAASWILQYTWIQLVGGTYLLYLAIQHLFRKKKLSPIKKQSSFWKVILTIELFDLLFAIDSIVAGLGFIDGKISKLWLVYFGAMVGLIAVRWGAKWISTLMDKLPKLELSAYLLVGLIGIRLCLSSIGIPFPPYLFWPIVLFFFVSPLFPSKK